MTEHTSSPRTTQTTTEQPHHTVPAGSTTAARDAVTALLTQACPDATPPAWLPTAAATIADWHHQYPSPAQVIADLTVQLTTLRRAVRDRVERAVRDGHLDRSSASEALRGWGLGSTDTNADHPIMLNRSVQG